MSGSGPLNRRVRSVARREFLARVRSRWFLFSTLVVPLLFLGAMVLPAVLVDRSAGEPKPLLIVDESAEGLADPLQLSEVYHPGVLSEIALYLHQQVVVVAVQRLSLALRGGEMGGGEA